MLKKSLTSNETEPETHFGFGEDVRTSDFVVKKSPPPETSFTPTHFQRNCLSIDIETELTYVGKISSFHSFTSFNGRDEYDIYSILAVFYMI